MLVFWGVEGPSFVSMYNSSIKIFKNPYFPNSKAHRIIFQGFLRSFLRLEGPCVANSIGRPSIFAICGSLKALRLELFLERVCSLVGKRGVGRHFFFNAQKKPARSRNNRRLNMRMTSRTRPRGCNKVDELICIPRWAGPGIIPVVINGVMGVQQSPINGRKYMGL